MKDLSINDYKFVILFNNSNVDCNDNIFRFETDKSIIWLVNPNEDSLDISELENLDNKKKFVHEIPGTWACLIQDKIKKSFRAISSINNELPWYYTKTHPHLISNNIFLLIKHMQKYDINYNAIAAYLSFDHTFGGETFLNQINKVYGGDIICLSNQSIEITPNDLEKWLGFDDSIQDPSILMDIFIDEVNNSLRDPYPEIQLTGGSDSRIILAAALKTNKKFSFMTGTTASVDKRDVKIAKLIAKRLNIEHKTIDASKREIGDINEILDRITIETNAEFIPRNYIIFYKEYILAQSTFENVGRVKGYGGEIFKGFYSNVNKTIKKKTSTLAQNYSDNVYNYINNIYLDYSKKSKENSDNLFYQRERSHFWVGSNIRATLSYCKVYNPLLSPKLLAAGYRVKGGIKNSSIHHNMLATLPKSIKKIPINYSKLEYLLTYIFYRKIKSVVDYNYYLTPEFLNNNINFELVDRIIPKQQVESMIKIYASRGFQDSLLHKIFAVSNFFKIIEH